MERDWRLPARLWLAALALASALAAPGCTCGGGVGGGGVGGVESGFRVEVEEIDFGKALVGEVVTRPLELIATGRADVTVNLEASPPFAAPASVIVPAGGSALATLSFTAREGVSTGALVLSAGTSGEPRQVSLRGRGVKPVACFPSAQCKVGRFDLASESCVEENAPNGDPCALADQCLEDVACRDGQCAGVARSCDDANDCTNDACSPDQGCINAPVVCQQPPDPCEEAVCIPASGCEIRDRVDGSLCGPSDCVTVQLCAAGACLTRPTPDGFTCGSATPCRAAGTCSAGECAFPPAVPMVPEWSQQVGAPPGPVSPGPGRLVEHAGNVFTALCGLDAFDGGCGVVSYTSNGFDRFTQPAHSDAILHGVSAHGVVLSRDGGIEVRHLSLGTPLWSVDLAPFAQDAGQGGAALGRGSIAVAADGEIFAALSQPAAGAPAKRPAILVRLRPDGGVNSSEVIDAGEATLVALDRFEQPVLYSPAGPLWSAAETDAGVLWSAFDVPAPAPLLSVASGMAFVGGTTAVARDGGASFPIISSANDESPVGLDVMAGGEAAYALYWTCRPLLPGCAPSERRLRARAVSIADGGVLWDGRFHTPSPSAIVEAALGAGGLQGGMFALTQSEEDGGTSAEVRFIIQGQQVTACALDGAPRLHGAVMAQDRFFAVVERGGQWFLERYSLAPHSASTAAWPRTNGSTGTRMERR